MFFQSLILYGRSAKENLKIAYQVAGRILGDEKAAAFIKNGTYPDFLLVEKSVDENAISVEMTRKIGEFLAHKAEFKRGKVVLINKAEDLNVSSSNSILKILEDPTEDSVIILTTQKLFSLLPTIRSRCQKIFIQGRDEIGYSAEDPLFKKSMAFFEKGRKEEVASFAKTIAPQDLEIFLDLSLRYAHCKFLKTLAKEDAESYINLENLIQRAKDSYLDPQVLISSCCLLVL